MKSIEPEAPPVDGGRTRQSTSRGVREVPTRMIRPVDPEEARVIAALAVRSKAHWG